MDSTKGTRDRLFDQMDAIASNVTDAVIAASESINLELARFSESIEESEIAIRTNELLTARLQQLDIVGTELAVAIVAFQEQLLALDPQASEGIENGDILTSVCSEAVQNVTFGVFCDACVAGTTLLASSGNNGVIQAGLSQEVCLDLQGACVDLEKAKIQRIEARQAVERATKTQRDLAAAMQPVLAEVWPKLQVHWLPGLPGGEGNTGVVPDVTKLKCLYEHEQFDRGFETDCGFFEDLRPIGMAKRIDRFIKTGFSSIQATAACDECLQTIVLFLSQTVLERKADVAVTLKKLNFVCTQVTGSAATAKFFLETLQTGDAGNRGSALVTWSTKPTTELEAAPRNISSLGEAVDFKRLKTNKPQSVWSEDFSNLRLSVANIPCTKHTDCDDHPWWFCAAPSACELHGSQTCSEDSRFLLASGSKCARGACLDGPGMAVDGVCPDDAVCPTVSSIAPFDVDYFDKFKPIDLNDGPLVCPCAFDEITGKVIDQCAHAHCTAYAAVLEQRATCKSELVRTCQQKVGHCDVAFDCNNATEILNNPPALDYQCAMPLGNPLSTEISASSPSSVWLGLIVLVSSLCLVFA
jgi:hypothetical protein